MPPKFDPTAISYAYIRVVGGELQGMGSLAPKLGPLGVSPKKAAEDIVKATEKYSGQDVTVKLSVQNRKIVDILVIPQIRYLIVETLKKAPDNMRNMTLNDVYDISRIVVQKDIDVTGKYFKSSVNDVLTQAKKMNCTVNEKSVSEVFEQLKKGEIICPEN